MRSGSTNTLKDMTATGLLDQSFFYSVEKTSRKQTGHDRSLIQLSAQGNSGLAVELEHSEIAYPNGGFSLKVKCGYVKGKSNSRLAIKYTSPQQFLKNPKRMIDTAARCAYFSRLLGRTGIVALYQDQCLQITDWYDGGVLKSHDMTKLSFEIRMKYVADIVFQVATLHYYQLIHGDIKPDNIMITAEGAYLIDLDGVRMTSEKGRPVMHTLGYLDAMTRMKKLQHVFISDFLSSSSDVYALGLTLGKMFPEFFTIIECEGVVNRRVKVISRDLKLRDGLNFDELSAQNKKFIQLIQFMVHEDLLVRPESGLEVLAELGGVMKVPTLVNTHDVGKIIQAIQKDLYRIKVKVHLLCNDEKAVHQSSFLDENKPATIDEVICLFNELPRNECHQVSLLSVLKSYLTAENFIATLSLIPKDKRMDFVFDHPRLAKLIPSENFKTILPEDEIDFITVIERITENLESYARDRIKMHDARVQFMLSKLQSTRCVDDLCEILNANTSRPSAPVNAINQYAGRPPTHRFFSFGYEQLIRKCFLIIDEFRQKHVKSDVAVSASLK